jgi:patatin-related protein
VPAEPEPGCEEIRVALAMNGGVSLAVWMGGCAVELDRARRARPQDGTGVYDVLAHCFGRRLEIDILTGTSAGGINAALLGGAMAHGRALDCELLRNSWIELGDLGKILHDPNEESPTALMDGNRFHDELTRIFSGLIDGGGAPADTSIPVPSLDVTMTDVRGVERRFRDAWGGELVAREHRSRFRFRRREDFTSETLADAARTSASFPAAFEPWRVAGRSRVLAGLPGQTWGIDGGLLDNAPIRDALELIPTKPASSLVRRYFCYVNGDPLASSELPVGERPDLRQVGGYTVNLPRVAPLVDHLYAIQDAVEQPRRIGSAQEKLLAMDLAHLEGVAASLFDTYARRRALESLEELLPDPSDASATFDQLETTEGHLPWIPREWNPGGEPSWEWGMRPAERILHLALDLLRPALAEASRERDSRDKRQVLLEARIAIDAQLRRLSAARERVTDAEATNDPSRVEAESAAARVNQACAEARERAEDARDAVHAGIKALRDCVTAHRELFPGPTWRALFGTSESATEEVRCFIVRSLAIEVVRRAFSPAADIESAEELSFVQLTPEAPSPIFSANPIHLPGPASTRQKLTGAGLGHFAGFYRRSWRANDFMWGRLDAAARVVDMLLLNPPTADFGEGKDIADPVERARLRAEVLTAHLLAQAGEETWLLEEALASGGLDPGGSAGLQELLRDAIAAELVAAEDGGSLPLTRALFQRAAQLEILAVELPVLLEESARDRALGSGAKPLELEEEGEEPELAARIKAIRRIYGRRRSLPQELTGEGEAVSDLGLQTITHAAFVGLAAIRTAGVPMSKYLGFARPPLLAIAGTVANRWWVRATAALGFWAAALFLASRVLTEAGKAELTFAAVWTPETLATAIALLGVAGFVLVPLLRVRNGVSTLRNVLYGLGLAAAGFLFVAVVGLRTQELSVERLLFAPGGESPPEEVLWGILALLGVVALARFPLPKRLRKLRPKLERLRSGRWACLAFALAFVVLSAFTVQSVVGVAHDTLWHGWSEQSWRGVAALVALVGAPIAAGFAVSLGRTRRAPQEPAQPA